MRKKNPYTIKTSNFPSFYAALFLPKHVSTNIRSLYAFTQKANSYALSVPPKIEPLQKYIEKYQDAVKGGKSGDKTIDAFIHVARTAQLPEEWTRTYLKAVKQNTTKTSYTTLHDVEEYMYGSSEVVELMTAKILRLPERAYPSLQKLGKAMCYLSFIRDLNTWNTLERNYLPEEDLKKFHLKNLKRETAMNQKEQFRKYIQHQIKRSQLWHKEAKKGFPFLPRPFRIVIKTNAEMAEWTARKIARDPFVVFQETITPSPLFYYSRLLTNALFQ